MLFPENVTSSVRVVDPLKTISPVLVADTFAPTVMPAVPSIVMFASLAVVTISPSTTVLPP